MLSAVVLGLILSGCDDGQPYTIERLEHYCPEQNRDARAEFTLLCIKNANPKSDEEPEDWIWKCEDMAENLYCEKRTYLVTCTSSPCYYESRRVLLSEAESEEG